MGRPPIISREKVAELALQLLDEEGISALSLERIAKEMGVRGPSLYHHFSDKAEILTAVAKPVLVDLALVDRATDDWQQWIVDVSLTFYRRVMEHPGSAAILLEFMPDSSAVPGFGHAARMLTRAGVDPSVQVLLMEGTEKITWGWALQRAVMAAHGTVRMSPGNINRRWPELAVALRNSRWHDEELLEATLRAFMDGVVEHTRL
jgi:TetR/AcrR family transcriptional regulator, tetracycline repressor protein